MKIFDFLIKRKRALLLLAIDFCIFLATNCAYYLTTHKSSPDYPLSHFIINSAFLVFSAFFIRFGFHIYKSIWRYMNADDGFRLIISDGLAGVIALAASYVAGTHFDIWHILSVASFSALLTLSSRFAYRLLYKYLKTPAAKEDIHKIPVAIVGAGQLGAQLAEELISGKNSNYKPLFFIDRNKAKTNGQIAGLRIYYEDDSIIEFINNQSVSEIFIAIHSLDSETAKKLLEFYGRTACKIKLYDSSIRGFYSEDDGLRKRIRDFQIEDLLFRKPQGINDLDLVRFYSGKTVLVTGGGGSIGSELCRMIAKCRPRKLIILDIYENGAYDLQQELRTKYGDSLPFSVEIASVRDVQRLDSIFNFYRPEIVFHAAAHKHVPLMEHSGIEAIKNNVFGTYNTANAAEKYGAEKFILISTDKAVNPTNIMGASKRMCEMLLQCRGDSKTTFAAVRFGNVLGSNGSVIPLFKSQIASGGPITITDKRIVRYFMTIPEASHLVMQAGAMAKRGELFALDMGKPIRIYDLAVNMIRLSGLEPEVDIKIDEIGLRPGEKLYEELLLNPETLIRTPNDMIFIEKDSPFSREEIEKKLDVLSLALKGDISAKDALMKVVPSFKEPDEVNRSAENSREMKLSEKHS